MSSLREVLALAPDARRGLSRALESFGRRTRERGASYVHRGRVQSIRLADGAVEAVVRGTAPYRVEWRRAERRDDGGWVATCSCPVGIYCKHAYAVATLLLGEEELGAVADGGSNEALDDELDADFVWDDDPLARTITRPVEPTPDKRLVRGSAAARAKADRLALGRLREASNPWQRRNAAELLLAGSDLDYGTRQRIVTAAKLDVADPDVRCWRLANEVARIAGGAAVPAVLESYLDRPDVEARVRNKQRLRLRDELLGWVARGGTTQPRSLRVAVNLRAWPRDLVTIELELHVASPRGESARSPAQLKQLHRELRDEPRLLPPEQAELLAIVIEHLSSPLAGSSVFGDGVILPTGPLRLLLERGVPAGLVTWSEEIEPELAERGAIVPGAPVKLANGVAHVAPWCTSEGDEAVLGLRVLWDDGRVATLDDVVLVQADEAWRGGSATGFVIAGGEIAAIRSTPPAGLVARFREARGLPLAKTERVALLTQLATRWPHLRDTLAAHTRVVPSEPVVTIDLREDDWLQLRVLARAEGRTLEYGGDSTWRAAAAVPVELAEIPADATLVPAEPPPGAAVGGAAGSAAGAEASVEGAGEGLGDGAGAGDGAASVASSTAPLAPAETWLEVPDPAQFEPVTAWLETTGAAAGVRRVGTAELTWPDRDVGFWLRITNRRVADFFARWELRPANGVLYLGNERARRLLGRTSRALPRVRIAASGVDFLAVSAEWEKEASELSPEDVAALRRATTRFVRLTSGWVRKPDAGDDGVERALADLGVETGAGEQRVTIWQLAGARAESLAVLAECGADEETLRAVEHLRARVAAFAGLPHVLPPRTLRAKLRPYQREGLDFLVFTCDLGGGAILADDMGLGKTVQTLAWLEHLRRREPDGGPALVVCPASVVHNWRREAERFVPSMRVLVLERGGERHALRAEVARHDLVITNYALLRRDAAAWRETELRAAVLDEAQNVKNPDAAVTRAALGLRASYRLALTGTPLENRPLDLWSIASFVAPGYLGTRASFVARFDQPDASSAQRMLLAAKLRPLLLRRLKRDVATELPERIEERRDCELTPGQRKLYLAELARSRNLVERLEIEPDGLKKNRITILAALTRLRQICCHPALAGGKPELGSGKVDALFEVLEPLLAEGHKVLVFSQFVTLLRLLQDELRTRGVAHHVLTGETVDRERVLREFSEDARPSVFLLSLKAGGTGLNLTAASYVVLFDPWWNPAVEAQAIDRSHRIGQDRTVIAYRLIARGTIEERIAELQRKKASLVRELLGDGSGAARGLTREDLAYLLAPIDDD